MYGMMYKTQVFHILAIGYTHFDGLCHTNTVSNAERSVRRSYGAGYMRNKLPSWPLEATAAAGIRNS